MPAASGMPRETAAPAATAPATPPAAAPVPDYVPPEDILFRARLLISHARYWDAIQVLESTVPQMEPRRNQHKGRILLAKAYAKNPKWVRRAEEYLHAVVREDPNNVEAYYELGRLYKQVGHAARAQAAFRRVVELKPEHREAAAELGLADGPAPGGGLLKRLFRRGKASSARGPRSASRSSHSPPPAPSPAFGSPQFTWENAGLRAWSTLPSGVWPHSWAPRPSPGPRYRAGPARSRPPGSPAAAALGLLGAPPAHVEGSRRSRRACTRGRSRGGRGSPGATSGARRAPRRRRCGSARATDARSWWERAGSPPRTRRGSSARSPGG